MSSLGYSGINKIKLDLVIINLFMYRVYLEQSQKEVSIYFSVKNFDVYFLSIFNCVSHLICASTRINMWNGQLGINVVYTQKFKKWTSNIGVILKCTLPALVTIKQYTHFLWLNIMWSIKHVKVLSSTSHLSHKERVKNVLSESVAWNTARVLFPISHLMCSFCHPGWARSYQFKCRGQATLPQFWRAG